MQKRERESNGKSKKEKESGKVMVSREKKNAAEVSYPEVIDKLLKTTSFFFRKR